MIQNMRSKILAPPWEGPTMTKTKLTAFAILTIFGTGGCDSASSANKEVVAVVKGGTSNAWWKRFAVGVADAQKDLGLKASMVQSNTSGDVAGQIALVQG